MPSRGNPKEPVQPPCFLAEKDHEAAQQSDGGCDHMHESNSALDHERGLEKARITNLTPRLIPTQQATLNQGGAVSDTNCVAPSTFSLNPFNRKERRPRSGMRGKPRPGTTEIPSSKSIRNGGRAESISVVPGLLGNNHTAASSKRPRWPLISRLPSGTRSEGTNPAQVLRCST